MTADEPVVAFASDACGLLPLVVTATGVVRRARQKPVHVRLVHNGIDDATLSRLGRTLSVGGAASFAAVAVDASRLAGLCPVRHLPVMCYARLLLPDLLPDLDRVLYLDNDLIARRDVADLWQAWSGDCPIGAVADAGIRRLDDPHCLGYCRHALPDPSQPAFNSGVLMIDLRRWRQAGVTARAFDFLRTHGERLNSADQDALNYLFAGQWQAFDAAWNVPQFVAWNTDPDSVRRAADAFQQYAGAGPRDGVVYHLYGRHKPWNSGPRHVARTAWLDELAASGWFGRVGMTRFRVADAVRAWSFALKTRLTSLTPGGTRAVAA